MCSLRTGNSIFKSFQREKLVFTYEKIEKEMWVLSGKTIGVLGLAFKPNTDDMRFAPSIDIITRLQNEGAKIKAYDPKSVENSKRILKDVEYCRNPYDAAKDSDALLILTEWSEFRQMDIDKIKSLMKHPLIIDGRNIFDPLDMKAKGIKYVSIGRK